MKEETYRFFHEYFREHPRIAGALRLYDRLITAFSVAAYTFLVGLCLYERMTVAAGGRVLLTGMIVVAVPAAGFLFVTILRMLLSRPRPFEIYDFAPTLEKKTGGRSFPSRHVFSIVMIAMAYFYVASRSDERMFFFVIGIILMLLSADLAAARVVGGVHFLRDVAAGAAIAVVFGGIMFLL